MLRTIFYNFITFLTLIGFLILVPPTFNGIQKLIPNNFELTDVPSVLQDRSKLPNYAGNEKFSKKHFTELQNLKFLYRDYVVWEREDFSGDTITIHNSLRKTYIPETIVNKDYILNFYGGSTTWGTGVGNYETFPSFVAKNTSYFVKNLGESGYISTQSLNRMINNYLISTNDKHHTNVNIFYEGVNDVMIKCRSEILAIETSEQSKLQNVFKKSRDDEFTFRSTFYQLQKFLFKLKNHFSSKPLTNDQFNCDSSEEKASKVALSFINSWLIAKTISEKNGDIFIAILQPNAFVGTPYTSHLDLENSYDLELKEQFNAVYPLIIQEALRQNLSFLDLRSIFDDNDNKENIYIDFCHVSSNGNSIVSKYIVNYLKKIEVIN